MATITVLAGVNGAGKSSVAGAFLRSQGGVYFNPDEIAAEYRRHDPDLAEDEANSRAWRDGRLLIEAAIVDGTDYVFETTLGGQTIPALLKDAAAAGHDLRIVYVGLKSAEQHIARVAARVARGGHAIAAALIQRRTRSSMLNLVRLLPVLRELVVFDNSLEADPVIGVTAAPMRLLHVKDGRIVYIEKPLAAEHGWAKAILATAMDHQTTTHPTRSRRG